MATEPAPDHPALREGRRERLFAAMEAHDLDVLVLGRVANIRYASGVPILWNAGTRPFGPGCVVVRRHQRALPPEHVGRGRPRGDPPRPPLRDHLEPDELRRPCSRASPPRPSPRRVGTDAMSPLFAQLLPMAFADADDRRRRPRAAIGATHQDGRGGRRHPRRHRRRRGGAGRGGGRAAARRERARADRRVHGRHGVAGRHDAGDPGRRPHHVGRRPTARRRPAHRRPVTSSPSTPASSPTATPARWDAPGPSASTASAAGVERPLPTVGRAVGRGCSTPAGRAPPPAASSTRTGRPASRCRRRRSARGLGPRLRRPGDRPRPARRPRRGSASIPGVVLVVTACVSDDAVGVGHRARAGPHHRRRPRGAVVEPVLEPRAHRSHAVTDDADDRPRGRLDPLREGPGDQDRHAHAQPARPAQRADHRHAAALRRPAAPGQHRRRREGPRDPRRGRRLRHRPGPARVHGGGALRGRPAPRGAARGRRRHLPAARATSATAPPPPSGSPTPAAAAGRSRSSRRSPSSRPRATSTAGTSTKPATPTS